MGISAKNILVTVQPVDFRKATFWNNVVEFARKREIENAVMTDEGHLLLASNKPINLNSGIDALKKQLGIHGVLTRNTETMPLPDKFVQEFFRNGYDSDRIVRRFGTLFQDTALRSMVNSYIDTQRNKIRNEIITNLSTKQLIEQGTVSIEKAALIENNKKLVERINRESKLNPDLDGEYAITFQQWKPSKVDPEVFIPSNDYPSTDVVIKGKPSNTKVKLKHHYIYSRMPGFGKTYNMKTFKETYNAHFVSDIKNWISVPAKSQFLIFEEVGLTKTLDFLELKTLTGGSALGFRANCKTHGESFEPREDVQVIMLSNLSIYEVYGTWDAKLQRWFMLEERTQQLEQRFNITRLDGSVDEDRRACMAPADWTDKQFQEEIQKVFAFVLKDGLDEHITTTDGKIVALFCYVEKAKLLLDAKYKVNRPDKASREAFIGLLSHCCGKHVMGLKITWKELITGLYSLTNAKKTGQYFDSAMNKLVETEDLKQRGLFPTNSYAQCSVKSEKLLTYAHLDTISDMMYKDYTNKVDRKTSMKRAWDKLGACFHYPSIFESMSLSQIIRYVGKRPTTVHKLLKTIYSRHPGDITKCMQLHDTCEKEIEEYEEWYNIVVFQPMLKILAKRKEQVSKVWSDEDDSDDDDTDDDNDLPLTKKLHIDM